MADLQLSKFGEMFSQGSGTIELMDDMGNALSVNRNLHMLGGGNPGHIPSVAERYRARLKAIADDPQAFRELAGNYGPPQGDPQFRAALARLLNQQYDWPVTEDHIALTNGSQSASFMLFNLLAGPQSDGSNRHIYLPLTPEYIGYADQGLGDGFFRSAKPTIDLLEPTFFKYRVDFDAVEIGPDCAAICVSRPTNPTGNVLTDEELSRLSELAREAGIPLIVDGAYGLPFPHIVFTEATPIWDEHIILCLSLSKIGLPGVRTGIVVARPDIAKAVAGVNAVINLTTVNLGPALAQEMVASGDILEISENEVAPFYRSKANQAVEQLKRELAAYPLRLHQPEGAIFLWLWFENLPIKAAELYERLKERGVLVISGHHFFPGLAAPWAHRDECLRVSYAQDEPTVRQGLSILADEVRRLYDEAGHEPPDSKATQPKAS